MSERFSPKASLFAAFLMAMPLAGCESLSSLNPFDRTERYKPEVLPDVPPDTLLNQGLARLESGDNEGANKRFADLDKQAPYSQQARKALLLSAIRATAPRNTRMRSPRRAAICSRTRARLTHPMRSISWRCRISTRSRCDARSGSTERAMVHMQELIERYPKSEYVPDVREKMLVARDQLAGKEMTVGRSTCSSATTTGAINRFPRSGLALSDHTPCRRGADAAERGLYGAGIANEAQTAADVLGTTSRTAPGTRIPTRCCSRAGSNRASSAGRGSAALSPALHGLSAFPADIATARS